MADFVKPFNWIWMRNKDLCTGSIRAMYSKFFYQCSKMQFITFQNFHIRTCFSQFLWFFSLKCWFKGQMMSKIHLSLPNAYKLMCFDRNVNGNRDVKFLECDKWSLHWYENLTLVTLLFCLNPSSCHTCTILQHLFSWLVKQILRTFYYTYYISKIH